MMSEWQQKTLRDANPGGVAGSWKYNGFFRKE